MGPHKWRFVVAVVDPKIIRYLVRIRNFQVDGKKRISEIQEAAQAHTSLEAISTVAIDWSLCLSVKPGWSGMRSVHDLT
jgi:hypothetical protein